MRGIVSKLEAHYLFFPARILRYPLILKLVLHPKMVLLKLHQVRYLNKGEYRLFYPHQYVEDEVELLIADPDGLPDRCPLLSLLCFLFLFDYRVRLI